jgi:hypothetical protein
MLEAQRDPIVQFLLDGKPWSKQGSYRNDVGSGNVYETMTLLLPKEEMVKFLASTQDIELRVSGGLRLTLVKPSVPISLRHFQYP